MAEGRMLKRKISVSAQVADLLSDTHRLLFTWGIAHLDVDGRMSANPRKFKALVCPMLDHVTVETIKEFFTDIQKNGLADIYEAAGEWWMEYPTFENHQNLRRDREGKGAIPEPSEIKWSTPGALPELSRSAPSKVKEVKSSQVKDPEFSENFLSFYSAYPRKEGRKDAWKSWRKNVKEGALEQDMIEAAKKYAQRCQNEQREQKFIKQPATFLNGDWRESLAWVEPEKPVNEIGGCAY